MAFSDAESVAVSASASGRSEGSRSPPAGHSCPFCGSTRVYRSHRRSLAERLLSLVGLKIRRCHGCNLRFARFGSSAILIEDAEKALRRVARGAVVAAGAAFVLAAMWWLSARQAAQ